MNIRTRFYWGIGVLALAAGAVTVAPAAHAGVSATPHYTQAGVATTSGYFTSPLGSGNNFTHIAGFIGSNNSDSLQGLAPGLSNGAGVGLCQQNGVNPSDNGYAVRLGDTLNSDGTFNVDAAAGLLGTAKWFGDPCANGVVEPSATPLPVVGSPLLSNIPANHTVDVQILSNPHHSFNGCPANSALFAAQDLTGNPGVWEFSSCFSLPSGVRFNETDAGVVSDTAILVPPAVNLLAVFAHLGITANIFGHARHGSFQANGNWTAFPVIATSNGLATGGTVLLKPTAFANDHFTILAGTQGG